jgi:hypothetical protein
VREAAVFACHINVHGEMLLSVTINVLLYGTLNYGVCCVVRAFLFVKQDISNDCEAPGLAWPAALHTDPNNR